MLVNSGLQFESPAHFCICLQRSRQRHVKGLCSTFYKQPTSDVLETARNLNFQTVRLGVATTADHVSSIAVNNNRNNIKQQLQGGKFQK